MSISSSESEFRAWKPEAKKSLSMIQNLPCKLTPLRQLVNSEFSSQNGYSFLSWDLWLFICDDVLFVLDVFPAFVNPYAIVFLFPPVPAILEAIIFEIMRCSKHPSKHPNIQACSKHPSTHPNIHPSISMHRSIQTSKQSSQFTNSTPQPTRQRNEASLKGAPRRILILNSRSYAAVFLLVFLCPFFHKATQSPWQWQCPEWNALGDQRNLSVVCIKRTMTYFGLVMNDE